MPAIRLLGPVEVHDGDAPRALGGRKERMLVVLLALDAGRFVPADALADALWHGDPPPSAAKGLQVLVARVRKALAASPPVPAEIEWLGGGYRLVVARDAVDVHVAEDLVAAGRAAAAGGDARRAVDALVAADALWRGPALGDVRDEPFAAAAANRLDDLRATAEEERFSLELELGRHAELAGELEVACGRAPYRERLWWLRMLALHRSGRTADALRAYQQARRVLADDLGLEPGEELRELEAAILGDDPSLRPPAGAGTLPSGEVTFVLTDLAGSTALWERSPDAMAGALARHEELVHGAVTGAGGVVLKSKGEGDATFSVFHDAVAGVRAAVELQRAMAAEPWPAGVPLAVRVAVHTGPAELRDRDYFGPTVNRAARIRGAGHGGQTLVSSTAAALCRDSLPAGASLRSLGLRRLRDLREPEHLFQVEHPELRSSFPPLVALDARPHNLPVQVTSFVGRDEVLRRVTDLCRSEARLVTLTGPGGMGKTRLSLQAAAEMIDDFPDGVWFVPLAAADDEHAVAVAVAGALGVAAEPTTPLLDAVRAHLVSRHLLLVLDNFEQVLDAAPVVSELLAAAPALTVLATSREWLHLRGEHEVRVEGLPLPASCELFVERGRAVRLDLQATPDSPLVADICARLDGLPLAVELVAARLRSLELDEVAGQLEQVLELAADGPRDQPDRQRTLRATIAWSVGLLDLQDAEAFAALSVFRGRFPRDAAAAVLDGPADVALASLADKSLLVESTDGWYSMLATVQAFAGERLAERPEAAAAAADRHRRWCAARARQWIESRGGISESMFDDRFGAGAEADDLALVDDARAAISRSPAGAPEPALLACWLAAMLRDRDVAGALDVLGSLPLPVEGEWAYWVGIARCSLLFLAERYAESAAAAEALLPFARSRGAVAEAEAWGALGAAQWRLHDLAGADASYRAGLAVAPPGEEITALLCHNLGLVAMDRGDLVGATHWFEASAAGGGEVMAALAGRLRLGEVALIRGRHREAADVLEPLASDPRMAAVATNSLVRALVALGEAQRGLEAVARVTDLLAGGYGTELWKSAWAALRGRCHFELGDLASARAAYAEAYDLAAELPKSRAEARLGLARVTAADGDPAGARAQLLDLLGAEGAEVLVVDIALALAAAEDALGDGASAWRRTAALLAPALAEGNALRAALVCRALADLASGAGDGAGAARLLGAADRRLLEVGAETTACRRHGEAAEASVVAAHGRDGADRRAGRELGDAELLDLVARGPAAPGGAG